ncbi:tRNA pseudouridine synthase B [Dermatophilus congolensis]|uniref:tRNA pseudouridine synthase B n=1 Tax=Dermatophilus congolensis TaxID=1863 RepID=A0AA46BM04_9MICO|nr:tRNA pseudouridine(55) synthase TruB [Dermatophilus congolensis]STD05893.1 tRNA pseudouridine synthase B [Dermatophilus congolensis]
MARAIDPTVGDGLLVVDKPAGWTSHQVVGLCRRLAGTRKVGHAGTLDPMATGVLVVGVNKATRMLTYIVGADKTYTATVCLGVGTMTDDAEGVATSVAPAGSIEALSDEDIHKAVASLTGDILQVPSTVSAIKIDGKRSYTRARAGEEVVLQGRPVRVSTFHVHQVSRGQVVPPQEEAQDPAAIHRRERGEEVSSLVPVSAIPADPVPAIFLDIEVTVSSGTYVRALARDLGTLLGVGGHLTVLRRTRVGEITLDRASTVEELEQARAAGAPRNGDNPQVGTSGLPLVSLEEAARASIPVRELDKDMAEQLSHGVRIPAELPGRIGPVAAFGPDGKLVAILDESSSRVMPEVVFSAP